jgi:chorismate mutase
MKCHGIRGATTVDTNTREDILAAAKELLQEMIQANRFEEEDIASIHFTTTTDLNAAFPAAAARELGLSQVPMLCGHEMNVPGSLPMCLRILILINTDKSAEEIVHIYIRGAKELRSGSGYKEGGMEV